MLELFREGLKLGESLARLPWKAARRLSPASSESIKEATELGERLGTLPFRAAQELMDSGDGTVQQSQHRGRIMVLGAGYAGLTCFLELQDHLPRGYDLVLVNGDKYHWFTTELHTYIAGEDEDAVRIPLSRVVVRPGRLVVGQVLRVDPAARQVELSDGQSLSYDLLVFALGSDPEYYGLPGVAEHSLVVGNWQTATRLRQQVAALFAGGTEIPPNLIIAGGGLTGVEVAGELADQYPGRLTLTLVEAGPEIMAGFAAELVQVAHRVLEDKGILIQTGNPITRVDAAKIHFKNGESLTYDLLVWAGGVRGSVILAKSGFVTNPKGRGKVDPFLRAEGNPEVYLVGDSASYTAVETSSELPPTAQAAVQMGRAAARNILRRLRGGDEHPFHPHLKGTFASLGRVEGVGQMGKEQFSGLPAMLIKHLIEAHHAWETGGGVMPLVGRLVRAPRRLWRGR